MSVSAHHGKNRLLATLSETDIRIIATALRSVRLAEQLVLHEPGDHLTQAYFPTEGTICKGLVQTAGHIIATEVLGAEGMIGAFAALDGRCEDSRAVVQSQISAFAIDMNL